MTAPARHARGGADALAGWRIVLTRSDEDIAPWARRLERLGAVPIAFPCIDTAPLDSPETADALAAAARRADWIVFTSRRGVEAFVRLAGADAIGRARIAAVGPATAQAARERLGRADLVGERGTAESLADALLAAIGTGSGGTAAVLLALAENAREVLERALTGAGAACTRIDVYRTVPAPPQEPRTALSALDARAVWLASPSAVAGFVNRVELDARPAFVAIGPSTAAAAREHGLDVAEAGEPSFEGLSEATRWETDRTEATR